MPPRKSSSKPSPLRKNNSQSVKNSSRNTPRNATNSAPRSQPKKTDNSRRMTRLSLNNHRKMLTNPSKFNFGDLVTHNKHMKQVRNAYQNHRRRMSAKPPRGAPPRRKSMKVPMSSLSVPKSNNGRSESRPPLKLRQRKRRTNKNAGNNGN